VGIEACTTEIRDVVVADRDVVEDRVVQVREQSERVEIVVDVADVVMPELISVGDQTMPCDPSIGRPWQLKLPMPGPGLPDTWTVCGSTVIGCAVGPAARDADAPTSKTAIAAAKARTATRRTDLAERSSCFIFSLSVDDRSAQLRAPLLCGHILIDNP
jgi:hypothetical protein